MKVVIQRVLQSSVTIDGSEVGKIGKGMMILVAFQEGDDESDIEWMCRKITNLRIFDDENGVMNLSVTDIEGEILIISQFTLYASTKKGNRPSYIYAAPPEIAIPLYEQFLQSMEHIFANRIKCGKFGADMKVSLINDGPVTIIIDSKNKI